MEPEARVTYPGKAPTSPSAEGKSSREEREGPRAQPPLFCSLARVGEGKRQCRRVHAMPCHAIAQVVAVPSSECQVLHDANVRAGT